MANQNNSQAGRVALITGANTGIGLVTARQLCEEGARVFIACRTAATGEAAMASIRSACPAAQVELLSLDLGDFDSVRHCAVTFLARGLPLHLLINNAGLAGAKGLTKSGFELAFGTNHMGHFLLTSLLLDRIKSTAGESAPARIVTVSSRAHYRVKPLAPSGANALNWDAFRRPTATATGFAEYGVSKLANALFSAELARRLAGTGVNCYALHPGVVASDVWRSVPWPLRPLIKRWMITPEEGAQTTLYCATSPDVVKESGRYYDKCKARTPSALAQDTALAAELWRRSEAWVA
jgi:retinol dehydrogenase 12